MESATNLSYMYYAGQTSCTSGAIYAGCNASGGLYVARIDFTIARPASAVTVGLKSYAFNNSTSTRLLHASISDIADDPNYINRGSGGGEATFYFPGWTEGGSYPASFTITKKLSAGTHYLYIFSGGGGIDYCRIQNGATTINYEPVLASTVTSISAQVDTGGTLSLVMEKSDAASRHIATFRTGSKSLAVSAVFDTALSYIPPRSWFSGFPAESSLPVTVSVQTYADASCAEALGDPVTVSFTLNADSGMKPKLLEGFASAAPYNTGAVSGMSCYVQGYSRAEVSFDSAKVDLSDTAGASLSALTLRCSGVSVSAAPYRSGLLTGKTELLCTAQDSRGRSATVTLTVEPEPYAKPVLSAFSAKRCAADGTESEEGTYYRVLAQSLFSSLAGENSCALSCALAPSAGEYGEETALESGAASVLGGGLSPDLSYLVRVTAADALGNTASAVVKLPTRKWALKFRPGGMGVAFGKAPEADNALELPEGWGFTIGGKSYLEQVYPVGALYLSASETDPATLFGFGTWVRIEDRFLLAAGSTYAAGATGGAAQITQTAEQMPAHHHGFNHVVRPIAGTSWALASTSSGEKTLYWSATGEGTSNTGGGQPMDILPPYLAVYIWQRTA